MVGYVFDILLVVLLVLVNAAFAGSELALVSLREGQLRQIEREHGLGARRLVRLARDPARYLTTIQIGITLAGFLASATAAVSLAEPIAPHVSFLGSAAEPVTVAAVTLVLAFFTLVFGELAPKRLAMEHSARWARVVAVPLDAMSRISRPAVWLLVASTNAVVRMTGGHPEAGRERTSPDELREVVAGLPSLSREQRQIMTSALGISERTLREVLVPRVQVHAVDADMAAATARRRLAAAGHSRAPVLRGRDLDDTVGVVHWAALMGEPDTTVEKVMAPAVLFPDTLSVGQALHELIVSRQQLALVIDEHGSAVGIVTLEDLVEEIVGEIYDETDRDAGGRVEGSDGTFRLPGTFPVHDLEDLGIRLDEGELGRVYTTVAGLILWHLGRLPSGPGDCVVVAGWRFDVAAVTRRAITQVVVSRVGRDGDGAR